MTLEGIRQPRFDRRRERRAFRFEQRKESHLIRLRIDSKAKGDGCRREKQRVTQRDVGEADIDRHGARAQLRIGRGLELTETEVPSSLTSFDQLTTATLLEDDEPLAWLRAESALDRECIAQQLRHTGHHTLLLASVGRSTD
ncbi:hypothetical protein [Rhodococcus sp. 14-2470-1a]|uniref:hypothetical protein n=1 Tax=Rhodococcus sp. 14-2470-1a TaxID=2023150 RepID=UPI00117A89D7|nr:hypothetical protein [Rhodococcus sp. 14-2470-1a]